MLIKNKSQLQNVLNQRINIAVKQTMEYFEMRLSDFLDRGYYQMYDPVQYERTDQLLKSVTANLINGNTAEIYLDLNYNYEYVSAEYVANLAAQGYHGNKSIQTDGRFWESFKEIYYEQLIPKLKENLRNQGLNIK